MLGKMLASLIGILCFTTFVAGQDPWGLFEGNRAVSDRRLSEHLRTEFPDFGLRSLYSPERGEEFARGLQRLYQQNGFPLAQIEWRKKDGDAYFEIVEGPKATTGGVEFRGNQAISGHELRKLAGLSKNPSQEELLKAIPVLRKLYRERGYFQAEIGPVETKVVESGKGGGLPLPFIGQKGESFTHLKIVPIQEGPRYRFGEIRVPDQLASSGLRPPSAGDYYSREKLHAFRQRVGEYFQSNGSLLEKLEMNETVRDDSQRVDLAVEFSWVPLKPEGLFFGNQAVSGRQLSEFVNAEFPSFGLRALHRPESVTEVVEGLRRFYQTKGFPLAEIKGEVEDKRVVFKIVEGPRARLDQVAFEGNHAVPSADLKEFAQFGKHPSDEEIEASLPIIQQVYRDRGFLRAEIGSPETRVVEVEEGDHFPLPFGSSSKTVTQVRIPIEEGPRYRYGKIHLPENLKQEELAPPASGEVYSESELVEFRRRAESYFQREGKLLRKFEIYQQVRDDAQEVDLFVEYAPLPQLIVGKIQFDGNERYPDFFFRREMELAERDLFDLERFNQSIKNLTDTGVVTSYDVDFNVRDAESEVDIVIHLDEKKRQRVAYAFGGDGLGGTENSFFYSIFNLLGLGEELGLDVNLGSQSSGFALSMASRFLFGTTLPMGTTLRFFKRHTGLNVPSLEDSVRKIFDVDQVGFTTLTNYRVNSNQDVGMLFTGERISSVVSQNHFVFQPYWGRTSEKDDEVIDRLELSNRFSVFQGSGDSWNYRPEVDYRRYFRGAEPDSPTLAFRFNASHTRFFGREAPISERLFQDVNGVRGFDSVSAGPWGQFGDQLSPVGGDTTLTLSTEYRVPVNETLTVIPFFDIGGNWAVTGPEGFNVLRDTSRIWRSSLGSEFKLNLPGGLPAPRFIFAWNPLRLDRKLLTPKGLLRLRDPATAFRWTLLPSF